MRYIQPNSPNGVRIVDIESADRKSGFFTALADKTRVRILKLLKVWEVFCSNRFKYLDLNN